MSAMVCPECEQGKHTNCNGISWDNEKDAEGPCPCALKLHVTQPSLLREIPSLYVPKNEISDRWYQS